MLIHGARKAGQTKTKKSAERARPRKSMKGVKKREKEGMRKGLGSGGGSAGAAEV